MAGIPVNYTEAKAGTYVLPDPLTTTSGAKIADANAWQSQRRPELVKIFEENEYGRAPGRPDRCDSKSSKRPRPLSTARRFASKSPSTSVQDADDPAMDLLIYLPANATGPVPLLLNINFMPNNLAVDDPAVKVGRLWDRRQNKRVPAEGGRRFGRLHVLPTIERGFGIATFNYADVDPDVAGAIQHGVRHLYLAEGQSEPAADEWGTIAAWAWGISRAVDYFETDDQIDAARIAITGVSRLGKTVMWAGANDPRIAMVIASCSGEGGAALSRRNYGETIAHLVAPTRTRTNSPATTRNGAPTPTRRPWMRTCWSR